MVFCLTRESCAHVYDDCGHDRARDRAQLGPQGVTAVTTQSDSSLTRRGFATMACSTSYCGVLCMHARVYTTDCYILPYALRMHMRRCMRVVGRVFVAGGGNEVSALVSCRMQAPLTSHVHMHTHVHASCIARGSNPRPGGALAGLCHRRSSPPVPPLAAVARTENGDALDLCMHPAAACAGSYSLPRARGCGRGARGLLCWIMMAHSVLWCRDRVCLQYMDAHARCPAVLAAGGGAPRVRAYCSRLTRRCWCRTGRRPGCTRPGGSCRRPRHPRSTPCGRRAGRAPRRPPPC